MFGDSSFGKILLLALALLAFWPVTALGKSLSQGAIGLGASPLLAPAASLCAILGEVNGRTMLVNRCDSCQIVKLSHKRPGDKPAIHRTYTVPAKSNTDLPFRGPGQSQVTSVSPCRPEAAPEPKDQTDGEKCAQLQRTVDGGLIIINTCNGCLEVTAERLGEGNFKASESFTLAGKAYLPMETKGASQARIKSEQKCR